MTKKEKKLWLKVLAISQVRSRLVKKSLLHLNYVQMVLKNLPPKNRQDLSRREIFSHMKGIVSASEGFLLLFKKARKNVPANRGNFYV